jgi:hypothetical protein
MIYALSFIILVAAIAVVTHKLNAKTYCEHNWQMHGTTEKCTKCSKHIPDYIAAYDDSYTEAA